VFQLGITTVTRGGKSLSGTALPFPLRGVNLDLYW
jgi:hypothetical protein